jgi:hypothetical protein
MDSHEMLVELLAIKLFEHEPLASGEINRQSWSEADPKDRDDARRRIIRAAKPEALYDP